MCGRYTLRKTPKEVGALWVGGPVLIEPSNNPSRHRGDPDALRYNIAPTQDVFAVRRGPEGRVAGWFRWGLVPPGARSLQVGAKMINARAETVFSRGAFAKPVREQRCLIPADGFIEWVRIGKAKHPFHLRMSDGAVFAIAGIWQTWRSSKGDVVSSCSIITTEANAVVRPLHDRMPVILRPDDYGPWLDPERRTPEQLGAFLEPFDAEAMVAVSISPRVNDVAHDDPECLEEVSSPALPFEQLGFRFEA